MVSEDEPEAKWRTGGWINFNIQIPNKTKKSAKNLFGLLN
jgi:hypothetical protein